MVFGILFSVLCMGVTAAVYVFAWRFAVSGEDRQLIVSRKVLIPFLIFAAGGFFLCRYLISQNQFVYYWDYGGYWTASYSYMHSLFEEPGETIAALYRSVLYEDYNLILPAVIALPLRIFGDSFRTYVLVNYVCFFAPVMFVLLSGGLKLLRKGQLMEGTGFRLSLYVLLCGLFTFNVFYLAMLAGYIDIACLLPASLTVLLMMDYDAVSLGKRQIIRDVLLSLLLLQTFLFRRYFAFFIVGFVFALAVCSAGTAGEPISNAERGMRNSELPLRRRCEGLLKAAGNLLVIGGTALLILLVFFLPLLKAVVTNHYAEQYAAYDAPLSRKTGDIAVYYGLFVPALAAAGLAAAVWKKRLRRESVFLALCIFGAAASFFRVQAMGVQHIYILAVPFALLALSGIGQVCCLVPSAPGRKAVAAVCAAVLACGCVYGFFPAARQILAPGRKLYPASHQALRRNDLDELQELADYLNSYTVPWHKSFYTLASGPALNADILRSLEKPENDNAVRNELPTADVDLRDGFPNWFFMADYVVVTDPVDLHLPAGTQEVVRALAGEVTSSASPIGRHFRAMKRTFMLGNNTAVTVYQRVSDYEPADIEYLKAYYNGLYPDYPELFSDRFDVVLEDFAQGTG